MSEHRATPGPIPSAMTVRFLIAYARSIPARLRAVAEVAWAITTSEEAPMTFDSWLESPYTLAAERDAMHEDFQQTKAFEEAFQEWYEGEEWYEVEPDVMMAVIDFVETSSYADSFDTWIYRGSPT